MCEELKDVPENYSMHEDQKPNSAKVSISARNLLKSYPNGKIFYIFRLKNASTDQVEAMQTEEPITGDKGLVMDAIDIELLQESGKIERGRDEKLCRHNDNSRCIHCSPLEPWDENYLKEQKIKHLSFHSYLRKMSSSASGSVHFSANFF